MRKVSYQQRPDNCCTVRILEWESDGEGDSRRCFLYLNTPGTVQRRLLMTVHSDWYSRYMSPNYYWTFGLDYVQDIATALAQFNKRKNVRSVVGESGVLY